MNNFIQTLNERKGELLTATFQHLSISLIAFVDCDLDCDTNCNLVSQP